MKGKSISFADVLKRKQKENQFEGSRTNRTRSTLMDLLGQWEQNRSEDYTLYLGQSSFSKMRTSQHLLVSKNQSRGGMFDSWIEKQAFQNKENNESANNRYFKENRQKNPVKKIVLNSKGQTARGLMQKSEVSSKSMNSYKRPNIEIELSTSNDYDIDLSNQTYRENKMNNFEEDKMFRESDCQVGEMKTSNRLVYSNCSESNIQQSKEAKVKKEIEIKRPPQSTHESSKTIKQSRAKEIRQLVNQTDNIHEQIASLAHQFVLEEKRKRESEEEELLLSLEDGKKLGAQVHNIDISDDKSNEQQVARQKLYEKAKKSIETFVKNKINNAPLPHFGFKKFEIQDEVAKEKPAIKLQDKEEKNPCSVNTGEVGYSFAVNVPQESEVNIVKVKQEEIPMLNMSEAPLIPLIQEIASERHPSEANEEIENMYSRWKLDSKQKYEHAGIPSIESVNYYRIEELKELKHEKVKEDLAEKAQFQNQTEFKYFQPELTPEIMPVNEVQAIENASQGSQNKKSSGQKPEIIVKIPSNYQNSEMKDISLIEEKERVNTKIDILCLSQSPKKLQSSQKKIFETPREESQLSAKVANSHRMCSSNKSKEIDIEQKMKQKCISLHNSGVVPNREIYLSNHEEEQQSELKNQQAQDLTIHDNTHNFNFKNETGIITNSQVNQIKIQTKQIIDVDIKKRSLSNYLHNYGLKIVYSNNKNEEIAPSSTDPSLKTSEFNEGQQSQSTAQLNLTSDYNQHSFKQTSNLQNKSKEQEKISVDTLDRDKKKSSGNKPPLSGGSNRSKERNQCKIESYAHTNIFSINPKEVKKELPLQKSKQSEEEEFNFDF